VRARVLLAAGALAVSGAYAAGVVPCTVVVLQPTCQLMVTGGPVLDTSELIRVERVGADAQGGSDGASTTSGTILATTIEVSEPQGWLAWLDAHREPRTAMIARSLLVPRGEGLDAVAAEGRRSMEESQRRAAGLALHAIGLIAPPGLDPAEWPVTVAFATEGVGGPSAGLMIALAVASRAAPTDLAAGLTLAGTGALSPSGAVLGVGGVDHKLRSVARPGAVALDAFLLPAADLALARRTVLEVDVLLVPVSDLAAALAALDELRAGRTPQGAVLLSAGGGVSR
jgi:PDZ domain-containing secreted protein